MLDGFGGSGVRGIRFSLEVGGDVHISETNPVASGIIKNNAVRNKVDIAIHDREGFAETSRRIGFDFIDVDPYGTVVPYFDAAVMNVKNGGYLGITATDLSVLTGSFSGKTYRRYSARIRKDTFMHEKGVRVLLGYCARRTASFDRWLEPLASFWRGHFYRIMVRVHSGARGSDKMLEKIGYLNEGEIFNGFYPDMDEGPIWKGDLENEEFLDGIELPDYYNNKGALTTLLNRMRREDECILFTDLTDVARNTRSDVMSTSNAIQRMKDMGIDAYRTHFSPTGLKAKPGAGSLFDLLRKASTK